MFFFIFYKGLRRFDKPAKDSPLRAIPRIVKPPGKLQRPVEGHSTESPLGTADEWQGSGLQCTGAVPDTKQGEVY